jgi:hypothetical protein
MKVIVIVIGAFQMMPALLFLVVRSENAQPKVHDVSS